MPVGRSPLLRTASAHRSGLDAVVRFESLASNSFCTPKPIKKPMNFLQQQDPDIWTAIEAEATRQREGLEMIASENYTSPAIMQAAGSVLTNKYAEGYPGRRYYGGCEHVDVIETLAIERAKKLFGAEAANVQPHSGSQANTAVYLSCLEVGDSVLGLDLAQGGHLTHGMKLNISGRLYHFHSYGVDPKNHRLDFDQIAKLAREKKPKLIVAGASAYPREIPHDRFAEIANDVGAKLMVDMAHYAGLVASGQHNSPVPYADYVTTTTHKTLRGPRSGLVLCKEENLKLVNRNVFPGTQGGPLMHVIAGKAVCFAEAMTPEFKAYGKAVVENAKTLADTLLAAGLPLVSGGTDNHLMLVDVTALGLGGKKAEAVLDQCGITVNMNMIPFDERKPMDPSGIRIGTPALTTRGMGTEEMKRVGGWIHQGLSHPDDSALHQTIRSEICELCKSFPVPAERCN
ncbi:Serine hydroxymethyltransferase [Novipirellula artificiosorum]|uniref:Serine hydroxymethyltransferase n=2 Tax=Novipirellula artificiosorum TaxID=2528016 RepID=A0A5C6D9H6_9BACT|nr:Serine hydroxymethyltransferase [Novipirellula artificiosorum]